MGDHAPVLDPARFYWESLGQSVLRLQRCDTCRRRQWPVAPVCSNCLSEALSWEEEVPHGRVVSWCTYHRAFSDQFASQVPYVVGLVELDSGETLVTRLHFEQFMPALGLEVEGFYIGDNDGTGRLEFRPRTEGSDE